MEKETVFIPAHLKLVLTIKEAAEYSNIGINKIDSMLRMPHYPFVLSVGTKKLVKRKEFEEYISRQISLRKQGKIYSLFFKKFYGIACGIGQYML